MNIKHIKTNHREDVLYDSFTQSSKNVQNYTVKLRDTDIRGKTRRKGKGLFRVMVASGGWRVGGEWNHGILIMFCFVFFKLGCGFMGA